MVFNLTLKRLSNICLNFWKKTMRQIWEFWSIIYTDFGQLFLLSILNVPLDVHWSCIIGSTIDATLQFLHGYSKAQPRTPSKTTRASSESVTRFYNHSSIIAFDLTGEICTDYSGIRFIWAVSDTRKRKKRKFFGQVFLSSTYLHNRWFHGVDHEDNGC